MFVFVCRVLIFEKKIWLYVYRRWYFFYFGNKYFMVYRECMIIGSDYFYFFLFVGLSFLNKFVLDMLEIYKIFN